MVTGVCFSCGKPLEFDRVYRTTVCPACGTVVKVCLNCRFYEPGAQWDCRETIFEPVREKDLVNFCDGFELGESRKRHDRSRESTARKQLDDLFGG